MIPTTFYGEPETTIDLYHPVNITVAFRGIANDVSVHGGLKVQDCKDNCALDLLVEHA